MKVLEFERGDQSGHPTVMGATRTQILVSRLREMVCRWMTRIGIPGFVGDIKVSDELTGQELEIKTGVLFTRITINGRDYYFDRITGKFDGTGMGCS